VKRTTRHPPITGTSSLRVTLSFEYPCWKREPSGPRPLPEAQNDTDHGDWHPLRVYNVFYLGRGKLLGICERAVLSEHHNGVLALCAEVHRAINGLCLAFSPRGTPKFFVFFVGQASVPRGSHNLLAPLVNDSFDHSTKFLGPRCSTGGYPVALVR